ncbi:PKD domain-containing protein [Flavobacterium cerinum]|uniref:PKD domain-containing protein n=1 Tax=Flavobacterium cerinum TaxID=2502784 RepID=A0ABY5IWQ1_9FLAO|nr:PKD domain-containing protein [Flavobacterium cerinum]UUC45932.1 PKD domain-containing protein [Flavobacterium cerinum]
MKKQYLTILIVLLIAIKGFAQSEPCLTDELMRNAIKENPSLQNYLDEMDRTINQTSNSSSKLASTSMITIPVVVYIIHGGVNNPENIPDCQVKSQIDALNSYYNPYGLNFCLATKAGNNPIPSAGGVQNTPGIIHLQKPTLTDHDTQTEIEALVNTSSSLIFPNKYLRIWVVRSINDPNQSGTVLGYSMHPGTSVIFDGVVIRSDVFGSINHCAGCSSNCTNLRPLKNQGKTLVHEIGHYLGLYHTFHNGCEGMDPNTCNTKGDKVCDTPPTKNPNFSCSPMDSCNETNNLPDDIHNYMDYGDNTCQNHFTPGQIQRMSATLTNYRSELFSSANLIYTGICNYQNLLVADFTVNTYSPCVGSPITFTPIATGTGITYLWDFGDPASGTNNTSTLQNPSHVFSAVANSPYTVKLTVTRGTESTFFITQIYPTVCTPINNSESTWYFSHHNDLNFSSGTPVNNSILPITVAFNEACAIQNNTSGNVLFYTNGQDIWNSTHTKINTGNNLKGNLSSKRGAIITPNPSNSSQYYIFTTDSESNSNGFRYTIVNVNGSTVTLSPTVNQPVPVPADYLVGGISAAIGGEGVTAIQNCNGYWIITVLKKNSGYYLCVFSLSSSGLSFTSEFAYPTSTISFQAYIEVAPNGNKLVCSGIETNGYIFDFDKFSGTINNPKPLDTTNGFGAAFSPDSNLLYVNNGSRIFQYNVGAANIANARSSIAFIMNQIGDFQMGPDNKIYISLSNINKLGVIHSPNIPVSESTPNACLFTTNGPIVSNNLSYGLPNMINAKLASTYNNTISHSANGCLTYKFNANVCASTFSWNFGDSASGANNTSTLANPSHTFSSAGTYTVTLISGGSTITKTITVGMATATILGSTSACSTNSNATNNFVILEDGQRAQWSITSGAGAINGLNNQSNVLINWTSLPGTISVTVTDINGCSSTATKTITANCNPTTTCDSDLVLNITETANTTHQVSNSITLNNSYTVNNGVTVNLKAGNTIVFKPNSVIKSGAIMLAKIENCPEQKTEIEELKMAPEVSFGEIRLYPNPTTSLLTIETSGAPMTEITISSFEGKSIFIYKLKESTPLYQIDIADLQNGIYFLTIKSSTGELVTKKIIKQ